MTSLGAFLLLQILGTALCAQNWAYEEGIDGALGPAEWGKAYEFCKRPNQSPIKIVKKDAEMKDELKDFTYKPDEIKFSNAQLTNNGLYLELKSKNMRRVKIKRSGMSLKLQEIRFHWGQNDSVGSENMIDGKSYPLAMHLIAYDDFYSYDEVLEDGEGLVIIAVLFEIASEDNEVISEVVNALDSIQEVGKTKTIENMESSLQQMLPTDRKSFYIYYGTMTTPPCAEGEWQIYTTPLTISSNQMEKFRQLDAKYGGKLTNTDRPIQPLDGRPVYLNTYQ